MPDLEQMRARIMVRQVIWARYGLTNIVPPHVQRCSVDTNEHEFEIVVWIKMTELETNECKDLYEI